MLPAAGVCRDSRRAARRDLPRSDSMTFIAQPRDLRSGLLADRASRSFARSSRATTPYIRFLFVARGFALRFLQTSSHDDALALRSARRGPGRTNKKGRSPCLRLRPGWLTLA